MGTIAIPADRITFASQKAEQARQAQIAEIIRERTRRLAAGFDYDFGDARGTHRIGTTPADMEGWREVTDMANALHAAGQPQTEIAVITDTGLVEITAQEWTEVLLAAAAFRQPIWGASFALQEMEALPADVTADQWWPEHQGD